MKVTEDFRRISLIESAYKIIAKVLSKRLKSVLGSIISLSQSAFVNRKQILDGVLVVNECLDTRRKDKKKGLCATWISRRLKII